MYRYHTIHQEQYKLHNSKYPQGLSAASVALPAIFKGQEIHAISSASQHNEIWGDIQVSYSSGTSWLCPQGWGDMVASPCCGIRDAVNIPQYQCNNRWVVIHVQQQLRRVSPPMVPMFTINFPQQKTSWCFIIEDGTHRSANGSTDKGYQGSSHPWGSWTAPLTRLSGSWSTGRSTCSCGETLRLPLLCRQIGQFCYEINSYMLVKVTKG